MSTLHHDSTIISLCIEIFEKPSQVRYVPTYICMHNMYTWTLNYFFSFWNKWNACMHKTILVLTSENWSHFHTFSIKPCPVLFFAKGKIPCWYIFENCNIIYTPPLESSFIFCVLLLSKIYWNPILMALQLAKCHFTQGFICGKILNLFCDL